MRDRRTNRVRKAERLRREKMMFTVVIQALADSSQELRQSVRVLNRQIQEVEDIVSSVRRISAYDEAIHSLRMHLETMDAERKRLTDMIAALDQAQKMYMQCERSITDYGYYIRQEEKSGRYHRD